MASLNNLVLFLYYYSFSTISQAEKSSSDDHEEAVKNVPRIDKSGMCIKTQYPKSYTIS